MKIVFACLAHTHQQPLQAFLKKEKWLTLAVNTADELHNHLTEETDLIIADITHLRQIKQTLIPAIHVLPPKNRPHLLIICQPKQRKQAILTLGVLMGDYLLEPLDPQEIKTKINLVQQMRKSYRNLRQSISSAPTNSRYDPYLAILTRESILQTLIKEINNAKRQNSNLSIIILKINQLQEIENKFGNYELLNTLRYLAQIIKVNIRISDNIGLWSDHRFLLLLPGCDQFHVHAVLNRISNVAQSLPISFENNQPIHLTIAANAAQYENQSKTPAFLFIDQANQNLKSIPRP